MASAPVISETVPSIECVGFELGVEPDRVVLPSLGRGERSFEKVFKGRKMYYPLWIPLPPSVEAKRCEGNDGEKKKKKPCFFK